METVKRPHVILLVSPGLGHVIPFLELGHRLVIHHGVEVTLLSVAVEAAPVKSKLQNLLCDKNDLLHVEVIQPENIISDLVPENEMATIIFSAMHESMAMVRSRILEMDVRPTSLVTDLFGTEYYNMAEELGMSKYVFMAVNAWVTASIVYLSVLKKVADVDQIVSTGIMPIPGCRPVRIADMFRGADPASPTFDKVAHTGAMVAAADGLLVNSWDDLESSTLNALRDPNLLGSVVKGVVYPIGPVVREADMSQLNGQTLDWLNRQPDDSVLFISFGSGGALTYDQIQELALGLEASKHKFLWVLRPPTDQNAAEFYFNVGVKGHDDPLSWLPDGFLTRTKEYGLVISTWAPQMEILSHPSIGGFLSHCGWNSVSESLVKGVPIITWPLYAEQMMNAALVRDQLKNGPSPREWSKTGIIGREEVKEMVEMVMDGGSSFRLKAKELKLSAAKALDSSVSGSSCKAMSEFVHALRGKM